MGFISGAPVWAPFLFSSGAGTEFLKDERGGGFTKKNGQRGDLYILLNIAVPDMSDNKALIEEFASKVGMPLET